MTPKQQRAIFAKSTPKHGNAPPGVRTPSSGGAGSMDPNAPFMGVMGQGPRGKSKPSFMANGGMEAPDDIGGSPAPQSPSDNDGDEQQGGGVVLSLDQMGYHPEPHACSLCKHFQSDNTCEVAQQEVDPNGACDVFAGQDDSGEDQMPDQSGAPMGGQSPMPAYPQ